MADIDVVRKRSNGWLWFVVLLILALVLVGIFVMGRTPDTAMTPVSDLLGPARTEPIGLLT